MFGLFGPETVTFLDLHEGVVSFLCKKKRGTGNCKVRFALPQPAKPLDLPVAIFHTRRCPLGTICVANVMVPEASQGQIDKPLKSIPIAPEHRYLARRCPRLPVSLRVVCREIPGYGAVTSDIGIYGIRISTHGKVADGTPLRLTLVLDVGTVDPNVQLEAKSIWCAPDPRSKGSIVGVAFQNMTIHQEETMVAYVKSLAYRLAGDVMHRTIADGEMYVRGDDNVSKK